MHGSMNKTRIAVQLDEDMIKQMLRRKVLHISDIHGVDVKDKARLQRLLIQALTERN